MSNVKTPDSGISPHTQEIIKRSEKIIKESELMFKKEFQVNGDMFRGRIIGNMCKKYPYGFQLSNLRESNFTPTDLTKLIEEATEILNKLKELNKEG